MFFGKYIVLNELRIMNHRLYKNIDYKIYNIVHGDYLNYK